MGRRRKKNRTATGALGALAGDTLRSASWFPAADTDEAFRPRDWLIAAALVVAVFLVYQPVWQAGFIWDDDTHLLKNPVLTPGGVFHTWVPGTYVNYWPVTSTAYWVQYQLWGLAPAGFHLVNIALHALSAILIWRILALLRVPGAVFAAALFALHPVNVESVAWITQLKNTLSLALTLLSVLLYLLSESRSRLPGGTPGGATDPAAPSPASRSRLPGGTLGGVADPAAPRPASRSRLPGGTRGGATDPAAPRPARRSRLSGTLGGVTDPAAPSPARQAGPTWLYVGAVVVFALATLAKGMTLTLPVVLLACAWWQRGRIQRRDLWRVVPFLLIGLMMVGMEVWQQHLAAGQTIVRSDSFLSRTAVAGCAVWFYLWKLIWPIDLMFVYPRWNLGALSAKWFLPGLLLAAVFAAAWRWRHSWGRPVLMLIVCYLALLLPVLGFVNIYFMEYSLVADHWQYAAMIAPCAAFAGVAAATLDRRRWSRLPGAVLCLALLASLAGLTWQQSWMYANIETLYRTTIRQNPECWMAHVNLGIALARWGRTDEAIEQYDRALEIKPDYAPAHIDLGAALVGCGRIDEAIAQYHRALELKSDDAEAHNNLGFALAKRGPSDEAMAQFRKALEIKPGFAEAHYNLGFALAAKGRTDEAISYYDRALKIKPDYAEVHLNLGVALAGCGRIDEAIDHYRKALEIDPNNSVAHYNLGLALAGRRRIEEAMAHFRKAVEIKPDFAEAHSNLGFALAARGRIDEATEHCRKALALATQQHKAALAEELKAQLRSYESGGLLHSAE